MAILSLMDLAGFQVFGERERVVHGERFVSPAAGGRAVRSLLRMGTLETEERVFKVLADIGIGGAVLRTFMEQRQVMRMPDELGGRLEAVPIIPGLNVDNLSNYSASDAGFGVGNVLGKPVVVDESARKYKLNNLFFDATLTDKLGISARRLQSAKRLALSDPAGAAAALTDYIRDNGFPNARVLAGDYAKTVNNAIAFVHSIGRSINYADSAAPAVVTQSRLHISYDQFHLKDVIWTVMGPLKYATEINVVYQLAIVHGPDHALFLLGNETIRLGIDIQNAKTGDFYRGAVNGYSDMSGIVPQGNSYPPELTSDQQAKLLLAGKKVSPVYVGAAVVGSAVHVSDKRAVLNEHTMAMADQHGAVPVLRGAQLLEHTSVGGDLCMVSCEGVRAQWQFRDPVVGERVVLCFSVGNGDVEYSEVLRVVGSAGELVLSSSRILRPGASGAAVVSLQDSALLGVFSTMRLGRVICAPFTSSTFARVSDYQSVASVSHASPSGEDAGNWTYAKMVRRGLLGFLEQIEKSVAPLYAGTGDVRQLAGLVANVAGDWCTTVDPDVAQLSMLDGRPLKFRSAGVGVCVAEHPPPVLLAVPNLRAAEPGERVFVFTKVDDEVIMSSVKVVSHCLADNRGIVVEDFGDSSEQMLGGLIVAEKDAAVLGMYARRDCDMFGRLSVHCVTFSRGFESGVDGVSASGMLELRTELLSWVVPVETVFTEYVEYGKLIWRAAVGRALHRSGQALSRAAVSQDLWLERYRGVLDALGWTDDGVHHPDRYSFDAVAYAVLAMVYLRAAVYTVVKLDSVLTSVQVEVTPVFGVFPFPRASSAAGSVVSSRGGVDPERMLNDLEVRVGRLAEVVASQEKRFSGSNDGDG